MAKLTPKQERFVAEYLKDLNGTQSAIRAGYSARTANQQAARLLANVKVSAAIQAAQQRRAERTEITVDRVLMEYARLAFSDMRQFVEWDSTGVTWKDSTDLADGAAACVSEVSETVSEGGKTKRFKLHSKTSALSDVAKHLGMFKDKESDGGAAALAALGKALAESRERVSEDGV